MSSFRDLSTAVSDWSNSESSSSTHDVADMFESAGGIVSAVESKLMLLIQVNHKSFFPKSVLHLLYLINKNV